MKFLCVPCDEPMRLGQVARPEEGTVSLIYACPACGYEMAMLANPQETRMVSSLGVRIGAGDEESTGSKCPFTGMLAEAPAPAVPEGELTWTVEAETRMAALPEFVRPMVRQGIERLARAQGRSTVDLELLDAARAALGTPGRP